MHRRYYVYILANKPYGTLYTGITNDLARRVWEHGNDVVKGFTREHQTHRLVWYEVHGDAYEAIAREKLLKKWHRDWKISLIQEMNPQWEDLYDEVAVG
ncbi:MAG: GIY-YIG nuclease family protein [Usitatibacter sp.]